MTYEWDDIKRRNNIDKHGVDFAAAYDFEWDSALVDIDVRLDYREGRYIALGSISGRLHVMVVTLRTNGFRIITLRKANPREVRRYEKYRERI